MGTNAYLDAHISSVRTLKDGIDVYAPYTANELGARSEEAEQMYLFQWSAARETAYPALASMYHVPNGGKRGKAEAGRFKAAGVRAGVPDVCLPYAAGGFIGLYVELKVGKNTASENQKAWLRRLDAQGHYVCICYAWEYAAEIIEMYLRGNITKKL